jgi:hypothetical protein
VRLLLLHSSAAAAAQQQQRSQQLARHLHKQCFIFFYITSQNWRYSRTMEGLVEAFQSNRTCVLKVFTAVFAFATGVLVLTIFFSGGRCYVTPCYEGSGYDVLWELNRGSSFTWFTTSVAVFFHACYFVKVAFQEELNHPATAPITQEDLGKLLFSCVFVTLLTLQLFIDWQGKSLMIIDLDQRRFSESGRVMEVDSTTKYLFEANATLAGIAFFSHLFLAWYLRKYQEEIVVSGGSAGGSYSQIGGGNNGGYADIGTSGPVGNYQASHQGGQELDL